ncbi:MAG TPA: molybdopterin-binding protein [Mariprofundaceae bacterium]|nr:molybdopterin-binding protein [Mariprofundaceae bacterium]
MKYQSAAMLVIGNEVLSGRTREANAWLTARILFDKGCKLGEIAVVPDEAAAIIDTLNRLRNRFDAVITSGGIGPTHDDITMQAVSDAFGVELVEHAETLDAMRNRYGEEEVNSGRRRMARLPAGSLPIICEKSIAPGAHIGNVYILAGVPDIFASQLERIAGDFGGQPYQRHEIEVSLPESMFSKELTHIQQHYADVEIGSYPHRCGPKSFGKICLSSQSPDRLQQAAIDVQNMLQQLQSL